MESLYHETNRCLESAQRCFMRLEEEGLNSSSCSSPEEISRIETEISARINQMLSNCDRLDILVNKEPAIRRQNAKLRVEQLKSDVRHLSSSHRSYRANLWQRDQRLKEREQLLATKFTTNAAANSGSDTSILIDRALEHNSALKRSHGGIDDLLAQGHAMIDNLRDQRNILKGVQKKILDVASTLGMSNTVIRLIERRSEGDKYVLIAGMVITSLIMFLVVRYLT